MAKTKAKPTKESKLNYRDLYVVCEGGEFTTHVASDGVEEVNEDIQGPYTAVEINVMLEQNLFPHDSVIYKLTPAFTVSIGGSTIKQYEKTPKTK